jgi:cysteine desulfurase
MMDLELYLDNAATTPMYADVAQTCLPLLTERFGNPSSMHRAGMDARRALAEARERLARILGLPPQAITFTSGGTESDNLALRGAFASSRLKGDRLVVSAFEHPAVMRTAEALEREGVKVSRIPVTRQGIVDLAAAERLLDGDVRVLSCMVMNNELGTIQPLEELGRLLKRVAPHAVFHVDAVQAFGKMPIPWKAAQIDLLSFSAHKVHGPKGVGALVRCRPVPLEPWIEGGGQESGLRSGTESVFGAAAFALAAERTVETMRTQAAERAQYADVWREELARQPRVTLFRSERASPYILSFSMAPLPGETILTHLEQEGLLASAGSACHTSTPEPSHVLMAAGFTERDALSAIRLSFSCHNSLAGQPAVLERFRAAMTKLAAV